jgi:hypothetical protein
MIAKFDLLAQTEDETRILGKLFRRREGEVTGERMSHNNLYPSASLTKIIKSRRIRWSGHVARMGKKPIYMLLAGKPEGKEQLWRKRRRWMVKINNNSGGGRWACID